jgi:hypothetical protein
MAGVALINRARGTMTPLRQRFIDDLRLRNYARRTMNTYVSRVAAFAQHFGRSPELLGPDEARAFHSICSSVVLTLQQELGSRNRPGTEKPASPAQPHTLVAPERSSRPVNSGYNRGRAPRASRRGES